MRQCIAVAPLYASSSCNSWFLWVQTCIHMSHVHTLKTLICGRHITHPALY